MLSTCQACGFMTKQLAGHSLLPLNLDPLFFLRSRSALTLTPALPCFHVALEKLLTLGLFSGR